MSEDEGKYSKLNDSPVNKFHDQIKI
jgi:hypothetical protein